MDAEYRQRAGALADKYNIARLPVAPKSVGDDCYPPPTQDTYADTIICAFINLTSITPAMSQDAVAAALADDGLPAIEVLPDSRVDDPQEYLLRITDTSDTTPLVGYYEARNLDIGYLLGQRIDEPWGVFRFDESFFDAHFAALLTELCVFDTEGVNRVEQVRQFRTHLLTTP